MTIFGRQRLLVVWGTCVLCLHRSRCNPLDIKDSICEFSVSPRSVLPCSWEVWQLKDAVFKFLSLLKHNNTIICLQIFQKHVKLTYLFIWKTMLQSVILLWKCAFRPGMSLCVLVFETCPLPVYPILLWHARLQVGGKQRISFIIICTRSCWCPQSSNLRVRQVWGKNPLQYFEFGLQYCQSYIQHL